MNKYGVRTKYKNSRNKHYVYYAEGEWRSTCNDGGKFGTDDLNAAYQFKAAYATSSEEVFDKETLKPGDWE